MLCQELVKGIAVGSFLPPKTSEVHKRNSMNIKGVFSLPISLSPLDYSVWWHALPLHH